MSTVNPNDPKYVSVERVDTTVGPVATGVEVERSWLSRFWWLLLLGLLAIGALIFLLNDREDDREGAGAGTATECTAPASAITIPAGDAIWGNLSGLSEEITEGNAATTTALQNICHAHLTGATGTDLESKITSEFATAVPGLDVATHLSNISGWVTGASWCHC